MSVLAVVSATLLGTAVATPPDKANNKAADEDVIVVTGERVTRQQIKRFVDELVYYPRGIQPARWTQRICPSVHGLRAPLSSRVEARMRTVAEAAGLVPDKEKCVPNVIVIVTPDKRAFLSMLARRDSFYFDGIPFWRVNEIIRNPSLAVSWHLDGLPVSPGGRDVQGINRTTEAASRLRFTQAPTFDAAVVVIDAKGLEGLTTTQLADYASMRAYVRVRPGRLSAPTSASILGVIDAPADAEVPASLTRWDLGFLRGMYSSDPYVATGAQRSQVGKSVEKALTSEP